MNIGVYIGNRKKALGGEVTLEDNIINGILQIDTDYKIYILYTSETDLIHPTDKIIFRNLHQKSELEIYDYIIEQKIRVIWFTGPYFIDVPIPFISTIWDLGHKVHPYFPEMTVHGWTWEERERTLNHLILKSSCIISGNKVGKNEIKQFYNVPDKRIKEIPFPVPEFALNYKNFDYTNCKDLKLPEEYIFYCSNFWPHKNHIVLLHAIKILREKYDRKISLVLTGSDFGNYEYIKSMIDDLGIVDSVLFLGFVSTEELIYIYKNAIALVYPSFLGPNNLPPLEALALGCPVIASNIEGHIEQLGDKVLYADPNSENSLVEMIIKLLDDNSLRNNLIENGISWSKKWTNIEYVKEVFKIFDEMKSILRTWDIDLVNESPHILDLRNELEPELELELELEPEPEPESELKSELESEIEKEKEMENTFINMLKNNYSKIIKRTKMNYEEIGILNQHKPQKTYIEKFKIPRCDNKLKISIVTPSYNQGGFIEDTIKSVLDQNYGNLEYIIQDSESNDNTINILKKYDELLNFESKKDKGQTNGINIGFQKSTGDIMAYLNSDDMIMPECLEFVNWYFNENSDVDVIYGNRIIINENNKQIGRWVLTPFDKDVVTFIDYIPQETMFWRRSIWEKVGSQLDEFFQFAMDWDLIIRFIRANANIVHVPYFLGCFRVHDDQKTSSVMDSIGEKECDIIRTNYHGRNVSKEEVIQNLIHYRKRAAEYSKKIK